MSQGSAYFPSYKSYDDGLAEGEKERAQLRDALKEVVGCFSAAEAEGLSNHLINETMQPGSLTDLVYRRLMPARGVAAAALKSDT